MLGREGKNLINPRLHCIPQKSLMAADCKGQKTLREAVKQNGNLKVGLCDMSFYTD